MPGISKLWQFANGQLRLRGFGRRHIVALRDWRASSAEQRAVWYSAVKWVREWNRHFISGDWLFLQGPPGTGKTTLAAAMMHGVIVKLSLAGRYKGNWMYLTNFELFSRVKRRLTGYEDPLDPFKRIGLLILDELGVAHWSDAERIWLYEILDYRYREMLPTVLITNLPGDRLVAYLGERILDRISGIATLWKFNWRSFRR